MAILGWVMVVGGGLWMLAAIPRYLMHDPLDVWGGSMQLDMRWLAGALSVVLGVRLLTGIELGWLFLVMVAAWLALIPLKAVLERVKRGTG